MTLTLVDFFCGAGGSSQGAHAVPGVEVIAAANHWAKALESHALNFAGTRHYEGDIRDMDMADFPAGDLFWASPECPKWSKARGRKRDFDNTTATQPALCAELEPVTDAEAERSRALMVNVPDYLEAMAVRGRPVQAGVVENVIDCREWDRWDAWIARIRALGYRTKVIAFNSMHARPVATPAAPQSRDRLYVAYWLTSLGRDPDFDKWLRPRAWCPGCEREVTALQVFKDPRKDMGGYGARGQYVYRCPARTCRGQAVTPAVLPAATAIDWGISGTPIGSRKRTADKPDGLAPATIARIRAGLDRYATPLITPCGGTRRTDARPIGWEFPTMTTSESDALAVPPLLIPVEGRADLASARTADGPLRTQTARNQTGLAWLPFIAELRGGSSDARPVSDALATVCASGNHHGLVTPPGPASVGWEHLLMPYYGTGTPRPVTHPIGTLTTRDRYALVRGAIDIADVLFRMLEPHEILRAMAFTSDYRVVGNKRQKVRQAGNAVTPPVAEVLISALVEAVTGHDLEAAA